MKDIPGMQQSNEAWISMFRRIPANLHDTLSLGLSTGAELIVQKIVKLEPDFLILRGRVSGTQDLARVVLIPYSQLTFVSITRLLKDPEVDAIFGKGAPPPITDLPPLAAGADAASAEAALTETPLETTIEEVAAETPKKPEQVSKTVLLAKLRERMKDTK